MNETQPELADNKWVRFILNGQVLRDDARTLEGTTVGDNCAMHCLITAPAQRSDHKGEGFLPAPYMYAIFAVCLMGVWWARLTYRQYFSPLSTVLLMGLTFLLFLCWLLQAWRNPPAPEHPAQ